MQCWKLIEPTGQRGCTATSSGRKDNEAVVVDAVYKRT